MTDQHKTPSDTGNLPDRQEPDEPTEEPAENEVEEVDPD